MYVYKNNTFYPLVFSGIIIYPGEVKEFPRFIGHPGMVRCSREELKNQEAQNTESGNLSVSVESVESNIMSEDSGKVHRKRAPKPKAAKVESKEVFLEDEDNAKVDTEVSEIKQEIESD